MKKYAPAAGVAIAAISLAMGLAGCDSGKNDAKGSSSSSSSSSSSKASSSPSSSSAATSTSAPASGTNPTIDDYLQQNNIQTTVIHHDTPGAPKIDLPVPDGWTLVPESDDAPYGGIVFNTPGDPNHPPKIVAVVNKLTGNVDEDKLFAAAPGELKNLPDFDGGDGSKATLGGFPAWEIGGTYVGKDGQKRLGAQKTVLIKGTDTFLLQLNATAPEAESSTLGDATKAIDQKTTITP
jgi:Probable lipoprotein LpqN